MARQRIGEIHRPTLLPSSSSTTGIRAEAARNPRRVIRAAIASDDDLELAPLRVTQDRRQATCNRCGLVMGRDDDAADSFAGHAFLRTRASGFAEQRQRGRQLLADFPTSGSLDCVLKSLANRWG